MTDDLLCWMKSGNASSGLRNGVKKLKTAISFHRLLGIMICCVLICAALLGAGRGGSGSGGFSFSSGSGLCRLLRQGLGGLLRGGREGPVFLRLLLTADIKNNKMEAVHQDTGFTNSHVWRRVP